MCTKAFAKLYEMLSVYDLLPSLGTEQAVYTVHLCEAPGAFVCATNHYMQSRYAHPPLRLSARGRLLSHATHRSAPSGDITMRWMAMTLNPYFEGNTPDMTIDNDAFIAETYPNWYMGEDNSGDIRRRENIRGLWSKATGTCVYLSARPALGPCDHAGYCCRVRRGVVGDG